MSQQLNEYVLVHNFVPGYGVGGGLFDPKYLGKKCTFDIVIESTARWVRVVQTAGVTNPPLGALLLNGSPIGYSAVGQDNPAIVISEYLSDPNSSTPIIKLTGLESASGTIQSPDSVTADS